MLIVAHSYLFLVSPPSSSSSSSPSLPSLPSPFPSTWSLPLLPIQKRKTVDLNNGEHKLCLYEYLEKNHLKYRYIDQEYIILLPFDCISNIEVLKLDASKRHRLSYWVQAAQILSNPLATTKGDKTVGACQIVCKKVRWSEVVK